MSFENVHYVNMFLGLGAIALQIFSVAVLLMLIFWRRDNPVLAFIKKNFLAIGFLITFSAIVTSFFYSDIMGYVPCIYCWWDRVLIFPQAVIFGVAWIRKSTVDKNVFWSALILTAFGLYKSVRHLFIYYYGEGGAPCDASGVSCVQRLVSEFGGYISIPMLAFTGFFALGTILLVTYFYAGNESR